MTAYYNEIDPNAAQWLRNLIDTGGVFRIDRPSYAQMLKFSQDQREMFNRDEEAIACFCGE